MFPQAIVEFAGVRQVLSFRGTWNHGIEPAVFILEIAPQPANSIALYGSLRFTYGDQVWEIPNCLVDSGSYSLNANGEVVSLFIKDYRWRWEYANVSGCFNVRDERGDIIDIEGGAKFDDCLRATQRETVWLLNYLLDAMEVPARTIDATIPEYYPECLWDYDNAARALQDILSKLALRIAPQLDGSVKIVSAGIGQRLPQDAIETFGNDINPVELPQRIRVVSGPIYYTVDFLLWPALADFVDFTTPRAVDDIYSRDNDLRKQGWLSGGVQMKENVRRAIELSAFKWFRVVNGEAIGGGGFCSGYQGNSARTGIPWPTIDLGNPIILPDNGNGDPFQIEEGFNRGDGGFFGDHHITFLSQFELQDFCCERIKSTETINGKIRASAPFRKPFIWGAFFHEADGSRSDERFVNVNSAERVGDLFAEPARLLSYIEADDESELEEAICPTSFEFDRELGLVKFASPVYLQKALDEGDTDQSVQWPELVLRCAIRVKDKATGNWIRRERIRELNPSSPAKEIVYHLDDVSVYYEIDGSNNLQQVNRIMDEFINTIHTNLTRKFQSATATYAKWFPFDLDGAIQSITWSMSENGARMSISRNIDTGSDTAMDYDMRLRRAQFKKNAEWIARNDYDAKRQARGLG